MEAHEFWLLCRKEGVTYTQEHRFRHGSKTCQDLRSLRTAYWQCIPYLKQTPPMSQYKTLATKVRSMIYEIIPMVDFHPAHISISTRTITTDREPWKQWYMIVQSSALTFEDLIDPTHLLKNACIHSCINKQAHLWNCRALVPSRHLTKNTSNVV